MVEFWQENFSLVRSIFSSIRISDVADVLIVTFLLYQLLLLTRETRASQVLKGLAFLFVASRLSVLLHLTALNRIIDLVMNSGAVVVVVLFQPELRRALEQIGSTNLWDKLRTPDDPDQHLRVITELVAAMTNLARRKVGALIVIERRTGLAEIIESGTRLDSLITAPLIENIFEPNTPLHDGAVIIREHRIVAAACFLRLSEDRNISKELGTRHRAALGISEQTDAVALIVSEESGVISMARAGKLTRHLDAHTLEQAITPIFTTTPPTMPLLSLLAFRARRRNHDASQ
ncbi:MAG: diadenylate cyclase CdaA [Oscillospiraceae bacterium]|jgi:diadenylate cyclase|nr:diadenylate cyclase CdaA [Oscillospiraceae bacterium]